MHRFGQRADRRPCSKTVGTVEESPSGHFSRVAEFWIVSAFGFGENAKRERAVPWVTVDGKHSDLVASEFGREFGKCCGDNSRKIGGPSFTHGFASSRITGGFYDTALNEASDA